MVQTKPLISTRQKTLFNSSEGPFSVAATRIARHTNNAPHDILVLHPTEQGQYPLFQLHHGFALSNSFYQQLSRHIASHGYIVSLPQLYKPGVTALLSAFAPGLVPTPNKEADQVSRVLDWCTSSLTELLSTKSAQKIAVDTNKIALGGHSRGAQAALLQILRSDKNRPKFPPKVLVLLDPVDGQVELGKGLQKSVLKLVPWKKLDIPVLIVGARLGTEGCFKSAPKDHNYNDFYRELQKSGSGVSKVIASDYGHLDYLDDRTPGILSSAARVLTPGGQNGRGPMRKFSAGLTLSLMKSVFLHRPSILRDVAKFFRSEGKVTLEDGNELRAYGAIDVK